ncbi:hypothetical protein [Sporosarcina sp. JAI121]|uniref:hypothetical protein n=1 Tax=Sporosarcina sp. JAI121 TaxID=2723064 RepID=UPI0015CBDD1F|nr:hypothetical protein [Sporosarcina sp. JAI121]NYF24820.1 hypothetical protein [Sporosarcina sp. JAI121]
MSEQNFSDTHNPDNSDLPNGQPHFPKSQDHSQDTRRANAPSHQPPSTVPQLKKALLTVDPGALRGCLYRDTYIKLTNRTSFWFHPTYIDYVATSGYKWNGYAWIPWGTDLDRIVSFQCT